VTVVRSTTATRIDGTAAFFIAHPIGALSITPTDIKKSIIYGRRRTRFIEGKKANFDVGLN
jgi:hypothetical protein